MAIKKIINKLIGKKVEPEVNRVQVDINYVESYVDADKFLSTKPLKENTKHKNTVD